MKKRGSRQTSPLCRGVMCWIGTSGKPRRVSCEGKGSAGGLGASDRALRSADRCRRLRSRSTSRRS
jgi:hypothetical protein